MSARAYKCVKSCSSKRNLKVHQNTQKNSRSRVHACTTCNKKYTQIGNLRTHVRIVHQKIKNFLCVFCDKQFSSRYKLDRHIPSHIGEKYSWCSKCPKEFCNSEALQIHKKHHNKENPFECNLCPNTYSSISGLYNHKNIKHRVKLFECVICFEMFSCNRKLERHIKCHLNEKPFMCQICEMQFKQNKSLKCHLERTHNQKQKSGKKLDIAKQNLQCIFCLQLFPSYFLLGNHIRRHLNEKIYCCLKCENEYSNNSGLNKHLKGNKCEKIHGSWVKTATGEWELRCGTCSKSFKRRRALLQHQETHNSFRERLYACAVCEKKIFTIYAVERHIYITHKGIKNYECIFCEKKFGTSSILNRHILGHIQEKHFYCKVCDKELAGSDSLQYHKKVHAK